MNPSDCEANFINILFIFQKCKAIRVNIFILTIDQMAIYEIKSFPYGDKPTAITQFYLFQIILIL